MKHAALLAVALIALLTLPGRLIAQVSTPLASTSTAVDAYGLDAARGWLLSSGRLYITAATGGEWRDVTPDGAAPLVAAEFKGTGGWALAGQADARGLTLWRTSDGGVSWAATELQLYGEAGDRPPLAELYLQFVDAQHGWLVARHLTSANFSTGDLFATEDGGTTWERRQLPIGEPVHFDSSLTGSVAGGATGDLFYRTTDGGRSWQEAPFAPGALRGAGVAWADDGGSGSSIGWRVERRGECAVPRDPSTCRLSSRLLLTVDGGASWTTIELPSAPHIPASPIVPEPLHDSDPDVLEDLQRSHTEIVQGHGFDKCEVASIGELVDWYYNSPYRFVNIYFGGASRACSNKALSAGYLQQMQSIGWRFIPTWVGKQAPCYPYTAKEKMSWNPEEALIQGIEEANWASDRLSELGMTDVEGTGSVAYYDIEYYSAADAACHAAVESFVTGWSSQMRARGNLAGVYSTSRIIGWFSSLPARPDVIWPANWYPTPPAERFFDPNASVWDLPGLSNSLWSDHQRIRQYQGGHNETWGTTQLNIDCNVLDGVVGRVGPAPTPTVTLTPTITPTPTSTPTPTITPTPWTATDWLRLPMIMR